MNSTKASPDDEGEVILLVGGDQDPQIAYVQRALCWANAILTERANISTPSSASTLKKKAEIAPRVLTLLVGAQSHPAVCWSLSSDSLRVNGELIRPTACFIRYDVFTHLADPRAATEQRAYAWYTTLMGYLEAHPSVRTLNRDFIGRSVNKPEALSRALRYGLTIPDTLITNDLDAVDAHFAGGLSAAEAGDDTETTLLQSERQSESETGTSESETGSSESTGSTSGVILKPVAGGSHCKRLSSVRSEVATLPGTGITASPGILQEELIPPEVRIFAVGSPPRYAVFRVLSPELDYRVDGSPHITYLSGCCSTTAASSYDCSSCSSCSSCGSSCVDQSLLTAVGVDPSLLTSLGALLHSYGLDFSASDFKTCPRTGRLVFLEVNSGPMFEGFDRCTWPSSATPPSSPVLSGAATETSSSSCASTISQLSSTVSQSSSSLPSSSSSSSSVTLPSTSSASSTSETTNDGDATRATDDDENVRTHTATKSLHPRTMDHDIGPVACLIVEFLLGFALLDPDTEPTTQDTS